MRFDPPNGTSTARTFLVVFRPKNTFKPTWEQDARKPSLIWTHWTYNRSPQVIWFGSHRAMVLGGGTPVNSDPPVYITPESGKRRTTTRHRRFLVHPSIPCHCSICSLFSLSPERRIFLGAPLPQKLHEDYGRNSNSNSN